MKDDTKKSVKRAIDSIDDIDDVFEDLIENFPETSKQIHKRSRVVLKKVQDQLAKSLKDADAIADEAQLQAHLGLMEARDKLETSRPVMEDFIEKAGDRSKQMIDEAQLQAHLAAMEAEDYWERDGREVAKQFAESTDEMIRMASEAMEDWQSQLSTWAATLRNKKK